METFMFYKQGLITTLYSNILFKPSIYKGAIGEAYRSLDAHINIEDKGELSKRLALKEHTFIFNGK